MRAYWQFKNGSIAPIIDFAQLPPRLYVAWDRSMGAEVAYAAD